MNLFKRLFGEKKNMERAYRANQSTVNLIERLKERTGSTDKGVVIGALMFLEKKLDEEDVENFLASLDDEGMDFSRYTK